SEAPHFTYLTLDATTGQNAVDQVIEFNKACKISGIILNKMDGGAKGGVIVRIIDELKIPIVAIGNGESLENLHQFSIDDFLKELCL
ncbi:MAG: signal recognition particle-docking protein FtsY, partial [Sphingobacteriia bacterium]|nr:signal recognition particle-docking protein FtsY [Sphingobacteriia bacterium]